MAKPTVLPQWNTDGTNRVTPSSGQQATGWTVGQAPPSSWFNWLAYHTYTWLVWCRDEVLSAADIAAATWTWTGAHMFNLPTTMHGDGTGPALTLVQDSGTTALTTTSKVVAGTLQSTGQVVAAQTISTSTNITAGTNISASTIDATNGMSCHGLTSLLGESELAHNSTGGDHPTLEVSNTGGSGSYALSVPAGHTSVQALTATQVAATRGIFAGSATMAPINATPVSALPSSPVTGDLVVRFDAGVTYLYHCDAAPSSWSRLPFTRLY